MNCVSIQEKDFNLCTTILNQAEMAEIRMDLCCYTQDQLVSILAQHSNILVTCRIENTSESQALQTLIFAAENGAKYIDIEIEAPDEIITKLKAATQKNDCQLIVSYHNFEKTPSAEELENIYQSCLDKGADLAKIVTTAHSTEDGIRTLKLYQSTLYKETNRLLAFAMGKHGQFTRFLCLDLGAEFTYVSLNKEANTAPGQYSLEEITKLQNIENYQHKFSQLQLTEELTIPTSKSVAQRAILFAALAQGESTLTNFSPCNDINGAIEVVKRLGAKVKIEEDKLTIVGLGPDKLQGITHIEVGESGLLTRMLLPFTLYLSETTNKSITINGHGSILNRDLSESTQALRSSGAKVASTQYNDKPGAEFLPITISGSFSTDHISISGKASSQIVSGFLMTLPLLGRNINLEIIEPKSIPYIELTLNILRKFGINIPLLPLPEDKLIFPLKTENNFSPTTLHLDSDWSSAAFFAVAGAIKGEIVLRNMPINSSQADEEILNVLRSCGVEVNITTEDNLPLATVAIRRTEPLKAFCLDANHCPDLFPIVALLATHCQGTSQIKGVNRLSQKESNRAESVFTELTKMGAEIDIQEDTMLIKWKPLHGAQVLSHNDHRIAMMLIIASLFISEPILLDDIKCIDKSFPEFINKLK